MHSINALRETLIIFFVSQSRAELAQIKQEEVEGIEREDNTDEVDQFDKRQHDQFHKTPWKGLKHFMAELIPYTLNETSQELRMLSRSLSVY